MDSTSYIQPKAFLIVICKDIVIFHILYPPFMLLRNVNILMSNPLDSQKTKLLKTKTVDFSINNKQFSSNYFKKSQNNNII